MNTFFHDLRYAARGLRRSPGFSLVALLAIALGIATATTIFTFFNAILVRPLPYISEESRLVSLKITTSFERERGAEFSQLNFLDLRDQTKTLQGVFLSMNRTLLLAGGERPERLLGAGISAAAFGTLGVQPVVGRLFRADEELDGAPPVVLLGHGVWQRRFGGRESAVGQSVVINGQPVTIIGVMPAGFRFPEETDAWMPIRYDRDEKSRADLSYPVWGRLVPGLSLAAAQTELNGIAARLAQAHPETNTGMGFLARPLREEMTMDVSRLMGLLFGAVGFVLLIAGANVANLLLARAAGRRREMAIRAALGAGRGRTVRLVLTESLLLGVLGGGLGVLCSLWGVDAVRSAVPVTLPYWLRLDLDWRTLAFAFAAACGTGLLCGLAPALGALRPDLNAELKNGGRAGAGSGGATGNRVRHTLVVAQIALALVLLVGAGLMARSFLELQRADPGIDARGVLTFRVGLPPTQFNEAAAERFFRDLMPRLQAIPGVEAAGVINNLPAGTSYTFSVFYVEGRPVPKSLMDAPAGMRRIASPGTFAALRVPLQRGRLFLDTDTKDAPPVALVDQRFAEEMFPGEDPVGRRIFTDGWDPTQPIHPGQGYRTIVGVVGNVRQQTQARLPERCVWVPAAQEPDHFFSGMVRVQGGDPLTYVRAVQAAVLATETDIPIYNPKTMTRILAESFWQQRFFGGLFVMFAGVALFLAAVGIYGVMAYSVTQRTPELGVRMALGALPGDMMRLVVGRGARLVALGLGIGLLAARGLAQLLAGNLYGVSPGDPPVFFSVPILLAAVALLACWLPARRALRLDPTTALRAE